MNKKIYSSIKRLAICFLFLFISSHLIADAHSYYFNNNFNEQGGGPSLLEITTCKASKGAFISETIQTADGYCNNLSPQPAFAFNAGGGVQYPADIITGNYSIHLFFKFTQEIDGYVRVLDFTHNQTGIYLQSGCLNFWKNGNVGASCPFSKDQYTLLSLTRNGNIITAYVNGKVLTTYNDSKGEYMGNAGIPISFFRDDSDPPPDKCEVRAGAIKFISISDVAADLAGVQNVWNNICGSTLPVSLLNFSGIISGKNALLKWQTATETNSSYFDIEHSIDGRTFDFSGKVAAKGNSNTLVNYEYSDASLVTGDNYYRLKQVDKDGKFTRSPIIKLTFNDYTLRVFPSPAKDVISISGLQPGSIIRLISTTGSQLLQKEVNAQSTILNVASLPKGVYMVQVGNDKSTQQIKFIKE